MTKSPNSKLRQPKSMLPKGLPIEPTEQELRLLLAEYYAKEKGWTIEWQKTNRYWNTQQMDVFCDGVKLMKKIPDITDLTWLFELVKMLKIRLIEIIHETATPKEFWLIKTLCKSGEYYAQADTPELALAQCLGKIIKEET